MRSKFAILLAISASLLMTVAVFAGRPVHRVTGGASDSFPGLGTERYALNASVDEAGAVSGQGSFTFVLPVAEFHAVINCLEVDGNVAWIGMTVTETDNSLEYPNGLPVGQNLVWQLRDNGQGANAAPDQQSFFVSGPACTTKPDLLGFATFEFDTGNIRIE